MLCPFTSELNSGWLSTRCNCLTLKNSAYILWDLKIISQGNIVVLQDWKLHECQKVSMYWLIHELSHSAGLLSALIPFVFFLACLNHLLSFGAATYTPMTSFPLGNPPLKTFCSGSSLPLLHTRLPCPPYIQSEVLQAYRSNSVVHFCARSCKKVTSVRWMRWWKNCFQ